MPKHLKRMAGAVCVLAGGALLLTSSADALIALDHPAHGLSLMTLAGAAVGAAFIGAGTDLIGWGSGGNSEPASRNADVHGTARPATQDEALRAARGDVKSPLQGQKFTM